MMKVPLSRRFLDLLAERPDRRVGRFGGLYGRCNRDWLRRSRARRAGGHEHEQGERESTEHALG
jgi:hypothetical protein